MLGLEDYRTPNVKNTHSLAKKRIFLARTEPYRQII